MDAKLGALCTTKHRYSDTEVEGRSKGNRQSNVVCRLQDCRSTEIIRRKTRGPGSGNR